MGLTVGEKVPLFELPDKDGNLFSVSDFLGKKALVIYFYPKNNTPGCTKEACDFRDKYEDFKELGAEVIGISADSPNSHKRFGATYKLPFILLSDKNNAVRKKFKIKNNFLLVPGRETYVIDKNGIILMVFNSLSATEHMKRALEALAKNSI
jgi:peroxiredoxin Q/BCP